MPVLGLSSDQSLVETLVDYVQDWVGEGRLEPLTILVPQERLANHLLGALVDTVPVAFAPTPLRLNVWVRDAAAQWDLDCGGRPLDGEEYFTVVYRLLQGSWPHVEVDDAREVCRVFQEVIRTEIDESAFDGLRRAVRDLCRREDVVHSLSQRTESLEALWHHVQRLLADQGWVDPATADRRICDRLTAAVLDDPALARRRLGRLVFAGFTSLLPALERLIAACVERLSALWILPTLPRRVAEDLAHSPLGGLLARHHKGLGTDLRVVAGATALPSEAATPSSRHLWICDSVMHEVRMSCELARSWVQRGAAPRSIGIVVADDALYGPWYAQQVAASEAQRINLALPVTLGSTLPGVWLRSILLDSARLEVAARSAVEFLLHPWTTRLWIGDEPGEAGSLSHYLGRVLRRLGMPTLGLRALLHEIAQDADPLVQALGVKLCDAWLQWMTVRPPVERLRLVRERIPESLWSEYLGEQASLATAALASLESHLRSPVWSWGESLGGPEGPQGTTTEGLWSELVQRTVLGAELRQPASPLRGIQIMSLAESRLVPLDVVILVGAAEGILPKSIPQDRLLDDFLKRQMGLPGWEALEGMERTTFELLGARARHFYVCYPRRHDGQTLSVSPLVRQWMLDDPSWEILESPTSSTGGLQDCIPAGEVACCDGNEGLLPDIIDKNGGPMSASRLRHLTQCPYRFAAADLLGVRGADGLPPPLDFEEDLALEGRVLHQVLEAAFRQDDLWVDAVLNRDRWLAFLDHKLVELAPHLRDRTLRVQMLTVGFPRWIEALESLHGPSPAIWRHRIRTEVPLVRGVGPWQAVRGSVDRVDRVGGDGGLLMITDYKLSRVPTGADVRLARDPQLGFYAAALAVQEPWPLERMVVGYWSLKSGAWEGRAVGRLARSEALERGWVGRRTADLEEVVAAVEQQWHRRMHEISQAGRFFVDDAGCEGCTLPGVCHRDHHRARGGEGSAKGGPVKSA